MKKSLVRYSLFVFLLIFGSAEAIAQQGFGTNTPSKASAVDMQGSDKGLLIPRIALTATNAFAPITGALGNDAAQTNSLLVYNTATAGVAPNNVTPGYYYWTTDGVTGKWNRLFTESDVTTLEPWNIQTTTDPATANTDNIYQMGNVAIGKNAVYTNGISTRLDVAGAVRGGTNQLGTVGANSAAFGNSNEASGTASVALGNSNTASNLQSTVSGGSGNVASGSQSTVSGGLANSALGSQATVSGGYNNEASGLTSTVSGGYSNTASGNLSTVSGGQYNTALGDGSTVSGGQRNEAFSAYEWVGGLFSTAYTAGSTSTRVDSDRLFNIGNGTAVGDRHDAFTILKNGKTGVGFDNFENTAVALTSFNEKFQVNGNARFVTLPSVQGNTATDKAVVVDNTGVLKTVKQAPRFFYMPPVIFDTSQTGTGLTRDLYQDYVNQFTGVASYPMAHGANGFDPMTYTGGLVKSPSAPETILPVYNRNELYYYIPNYDATVFDNVSLDDNGILTYDIIGTATDISSMTIVFQIKE